MFKKFFKVNYQFLFVLLVILIGGFIRLYRIYDGMPFTFDQAEFSFYVQDILRGKLALIGPRTGIEGFFLGPLYFYLLVPFYLLFNGHPVGGAVMDAIFGILVIPAIYILGKELFNKRVGLIASLLACFSPLLTGYSRYSWNPHPLVLFSIIFYYSILKTIKGEEKYIMLAFFAFACGLQFEIASAIFYLPTTLLVCLWAKYRPKKIIYWFVGLLILLISFIPQLVFNLRHEFLTIKAITRFLTENTASGKSVFFIKERLIEYPEVFKKLIFPKNLIVAIFLLVAGFINLFGKYTKKSLGIKILFAWLSVNYLLLFLYRDKAWDHHYISLLPAFIILTSFLVENLLNIKKMKIIGSLILLIVLFFNLLIVFPKKEDTLRNFVLFKDEMEAIDFIYKDANRAKFSILTYVPSVYNQHYFYLFEWYGRKKYGYLPSLNKKESLIYFIIEPDNQLPTRLTNWLYTKRNEGKLIFEKRFNGGLMVQKRERTNKL